MKTIAEDLTSTLRNCNGDYENYEQNFIKVLNTHAPKEVKILRKNHEPHYPVDVANYKKQRNIVVSLNR